MEPPEARRFATFPPSLYNITVDELFPINLTRSNSNFIENDDTMKFLSSQLLTICLVSMIIGTTLFLLTFLVPLLIILRRSQFYANRPNFRQLRRISDFV